MPSAQPRLASAQPLSERMWRWPPPGRRSASVSRPPTPPLLVSCVLLQSASPAMP